MIGFFDSGVGGLGVWRELRRLLPGADTLYVADQANLPYGPRPREEVLAFSVAITDFLVSRGAHVVVVACNSASAAALHPLRDRFPTTRIVGMEPALKPAARETRTGSVGVLATPATFDGELFAELVRRFGDGVRLTRQVCPGLVEQVERGELDTPRTREMLRGFLAPLQAAGADRIVLGCTHYPFLAPVIQDIVGPAVRILDPSAAVAAQVCRVARELGLAGASDAGGARFWTTGSPPALAAVMGRLGIHGVVPEGAQWAHEPTRLVVNGESGYSMAIHDGSEGGAG